SLASPWPTTRAIMPLGVSRSQTRNTAASTPQRS
ncbi:MAG: hypothetical protein AVDCRST_MAG01-01-2995, partial [uncultured Rubrobacteraceae bacterium]